MNKKCPSKAFFVLVHIFFLHIGDPPHHFIFHRRQVRRPVCLVSNSCTNNKCQDKKQRNNSRRPFPHAKSISPRWKVRNPTPPLHVIPAPSGGGSASGGKAGIQGYYVILSENPWIQNQIQSTGKVLEHVLMRQQLVNGLRQIKKTLIRIG